MGECFTELFASGALFLCLKNPFWAPHYACFPRSWESEGLGGEIFIQDTGGYNIFQEVTLNEEEPDVLLDYLLKIY